jgi:putative transcriptional regulator
MNGHGKSVAMNHGRPLSRPSRVPPASTGAGMMSGMMRRLWGPAVLAVAVVCGTAAAWAQSTDIKDLGVGKLLVSSRGLPDPNFVDSVVLLIQHDQQGTVGLMINRRTQAPISSILQDLNPAKHRSDPIYVGGPVELSAVFGLLRSRKKLDGATSLLSEVYLVSSKALLEKTLAASSGPSDLRLYLGYCGWAGGQLENEVRHGGWWIFDANAGVVFDSEPDSLWSRLIARTERQIAETEPVWSVDFDHPLKGY